MQALDPRRFLPVSARPPADSLAFYAVLAAVGIAELVEWPAVLLAAAAQALVDRRFIEIEQYSQVQPRRPAPEPISDPPVADQTNRP